MFINRRNIKFHPLSESYFHYCDMPSLNELLRKDWLIRTLYQFDGVYGTWSELDRLWISAGEILQNSLVSLINPSSQLVVRSIPPTWTQFEGEKPNGTTQYINTNWFPSNGIKPTTNSNCVFTYSRENILGKGADLGCSSAAAGFMGINSRFTGDLMLGAANDTSLTITKANSDSRGLFVAQRNDASTIEFFKNGASLGTAASVSSTLSTTSLCVGIYNFNNVLTSPGTRQQSFWGVGSGLINQAKFYEILNGYMTLIGKNV